MRTDIPICSFGYRKVLSDVKKHKIDIEGKDAEITNLKKSFDELCVSRKCTLSEVAELSSSKNDIDSDICDKETASEEVDLLVDRYGGTVRQTIITPGGTKRKGKIKMDL